MILDSTSSKRIWLHVRILSLSMQRKQTDQRITISTLSVSSYSFKKTLFFLEIRNNCQTTKKGMINSTCGFLHSAFDSNLIISDFVAFENDIKQLFLSTKNCNGGNVTAYTSQGSVYSLIQKLSCKNWARDFS